MKRAPLLLAVLFLSNSCFLIPGSKQPPPASPQIKADSFLQFSAQISKQDTSQLVISNIGDTTLTIQFSLKPDTFFEVLENRPVEVLSHSTKIIKIIFKPARLGSVREILLVKAKPLLDTEVFLYGEGTGRDQNTSRIHSKLDSLARLLDAIEKDSTKSEKEKEEKLKNYTKEVFKDLEPEFERVSNNIIGEPQKNYNTLEIVRESNYPNSNQYHVINKRHVNYGIDVINLSKFEKQTTFSVGSFKKSIYNPKIEIDPLTIQPIPNDLARDLDSGDTLLFCFRKGFSQIRNNFVNSKQYFKRAEIDKGFRILFSNIDYDFDYNSIYSDANVLASFINALDFSAKFFRYTGTGILDQFAMNFCESMKINIRNSNSEQPFAALFKNSIDHALERTGEQRLKQRFLAAWWYQYLASNTDNEALSENLISLLIRTFESLRNLAKFYLFFDDYVRFMHDWYAAKDCNFLFSRNMKRADLLFTKSKAIYDDRYQVKGRIGTGDFILQLGNKFIFEADNKYGCDLTDINRTPILFDKTPIENETFKIELNIYPDAEYEDYLLNNLSRRKSLFFYTGLAIVLINDNLLYRFELNYAKHSESEELHKQISWEIHSPDSLGAIEEFGSPDVEQRRYNYDQKNVYAFRKEKPLSSNDSYDTIGLVVSGKRTGANQFNISFMYRINGEEIPFNRFKNESNSITIHARQLSKGYAAINKSYRGRLGACWRFVESKDR